MSLKKKLGKVLLFAFLQVGALGGVPMSPQQIEELMEVIHRQGFEHLHQVRRCILEPNGTFYVEPFEPSSTEKQHAELLVKLDALTKEVAALRGSVSGG